MWSPSKKRMRIQLKQKMALAAAPQKAIDGEAGEAPPEAEASAPADEPSAEETDEAAKAAEVDAQLEELKRKLSADGE